MSRFSLGDVVCKEHIDLDAPVTPVRMTDAVGAEEVRERFLAKFWSQRISERTDGTLLVTNCRLAFLSPGPLPQYFLSLPWGEVDAIASGRVMWVFPALRVRFRAQELRFVFLVSARAALTAAERARSAFHALPSR